MSDYISREALKESFDNADADVCESYPDGYCDWGFGRKNINDVIDGVPAADVEPVRRWIPCSERLPDMPGDYQVCTKNEYYGTKNVSKRYFNGDYWSGRWTNITHWMPLPEPPETD